MDSGAFWLVGGTGSGGVSGSVLRLADAVREAADADDALVVDFCVPARPGDERGVDVGRLGPERTDRAQLPRPHAERVELEVPHGVLVGDLVDVLVRDTLEVLHEGLGRLR